MILFFCSNEAINQLQLHTFQGDWKVVEASFDGEPVALSEVGRRFCVQKSKFRAIDPGKALQGFDIDFAWAIFRWQPSRIIVFWFEGLYELTGTNQLRLCLKYAGQGVEGEFARRWRPPVDFVVRKGQEHFLVVLERE